MRITKQLLLLFVILLSFTIYSSVIGATIYVTPNGASDAPCDVYTPCDIYFAATYVSDSDTIIFLEGAYAISPSLVFDARNITLIGKSKENTTLEIQYGSSSGVKSKSSFHMKNFTIYTTGTGSAPQYALQIQESTPTDFIEGSFEDITFTGDFYYMTSLIYVMATNGSVALRNINIIEVDEMFQQYFYLSAQVIVADQIQVISSTGIYDIFLTYSDYLSISNFVMHNSTATSYIIRQNEWNNSNKSEVYLTNWEVSNSTFYSISLLGNITLDGLNINQTARGYYLFITSSMNTNSVITLNNSNILFDIGLDNGYYNYLYSSTANYSIIVDNSKVTKGYMSFNDLRTISLTNSYFLFCYFYIEAPEFYSRNSTYLEISTFRFDFNFPNFNPLTGEINGYIYVTNSSFINSPPDYYGTTIQITNTYSSPQMNTPVFWQDTIFYLVVSPYFSYYGDFPVTYENCYFSTISTIRGYEDAYYISNCPTETVTVNGTETYWAWGAVLVPYYYNCDLVCSQSVQFICDYFTFGGGNSLSLSWGYLMLILVSFVVLAIILIGVSVFVIMKRRRRRQAVRRLISNIVPPKPQA